jgi:hypothetical protein
MSACTCVCTYIEHVFVLTCLCIVYSLFFRSSSAYCICMHILYIYIIYTCFLHLHACIHFMYVCIYIHTHMHTHTDCAKTYRQGSEGLRQETRERENGRLRNQWACWVSACTFIHVRMAIYMRDAVQSSHWSLGVRLCVKHTQHTHTHIYIYTHT